MGKKKVTYKKRRQRTDTLADIMSRCPVIYEIFNESCTKATSEDEDIGYDKIYNKGSAETKNEDVDTGIDEETPSEDEDTSWACERITDEESRRLEVCQKRKEFRRPEVHHKRKEFRRPEVSRKRKEFRRPEFCHKRNRIINSTRVRSRSNVASVLRGRLNTKVFDHCFENIWENSPEEKRNQFMHFHSTWFALYREKSFREGVLTSIKTKNIFSKKYAIVPIVIWSHWYLLILCNLGETLKSKTRYGKTPCLLLLDSFRVADSMRLEPIIRRFVLDIFKAADRPEDEEMIQKIPLLAPKVPQERNGDECGIFALYYASLFLDNAPKNFSTSGGYPYFMKEDWFTEEELEGFYKRLESFGSADSEPDFDSDYDSWTCERITAEEFRRPEVCQKRKEFRRPEVHHKRKEFRRPEVSHKRKEFRRPEVCHKRNRIINSTRVRSRSNVASVLRGRLNTKVFDHCFENIWENSPEEKQNQVMHFHSMWFAMYREKSFREGVMTSIKTKNIFSKKYVIVPIIIWSHWCLLILCNLGETLKPKTRYGRTPCLLLLDSFRVADSMRLEPIIRRFVLDIFKAADRPEDEEMIQKIPLLAPKVPQQRNGDECGIFALYYASLFLDNAPKNFSISGGYPYFMKEDWFTEEELEGFYKRLESFGCADSESDFDSDYDCERIYSDHDLQ